MKINMTFEYRKLKAVFFDMDGTLIDSELFYFKAWERVLSHHNLHFTVEEWLLKMAGRTTVQVYELLTVQYDLQVSWEVFFAQIKAAVALQYEQDHVELMPGVLELIAFLKERNIRMAVVTSSFRKIANLHLEKLGILDYFDFLIGRDDVDYPKPNPEPYLKALFKMGMEVGEVLAFEDSVPGTKSVQDAGIFCIAVQPHAVLREQLKADWVIESLQEFQEDFKHTLTV